ncbi:MAG: hypothetical protein IPM42_15725 [Saprospiraceae bacterium]|nr:hypothetical protein [Saprospiraceae bacterium]
MSVKFKNNFISILFIFIFGSDYIKAIQCVFDPFPSSSSSGDWNNAMNWSCGYVPSSGDTVVIGPNKTVTISGQSSSGNYIWYAGTLYLDRGRIQSVGGQNNASLSVSGKAHLTGGDIALTVFFNQNVDIGVFSNILYLIGHTIFFNDTTFQAGHVNLLSGAVLRNNGTFLAKIGFLGHNLSSGNFHNYGTFIKDSPSNVNLLQYMNFINETNAQTNIKAGKMIVRGFSNKGTVNIDKFAVLEKSLTGGIFVLHVGSLTQGEGLLDISQSFSGGGGAGNTIVECPIKIGATFSLNANTFLLKDSVFWVSGSFSGGITELAPSAVMIVNGTTSIIGHGSAIVNYGTCKLKSGTLHSTGMITITNNGEMVLSPGFTLSGNSQASFVNNGRLVSESGTSTINLAFTNSVSGIISGSDTLDIKSFFYNFGIISPGMSPGELTIKQVISSSLVNATVNIEVFSNSGPGTGYDKLKFTNTLTLGGTLTVTEPGCVPTGTYRIIECTHSANCLSGTFAVTNLPSSYTITYGTHYVDITKNSISCQDRVCNFKDSGDGSLRTAIACAQNGDTINFETVLNNEIIQLTSTPIIIDKLITLDALGLNNLTVSGQNIPNCFIISNAANTLFKNFNIVSGNALMGSAILNFGNLTLEDMNISKHINSQSESVLYSESGNVIFEGDNLIENQ